MNEDSNEPKWPDDFYVHPHAELEVFWSNDDILTIKFLNSSISEQLTSQQEEQLWQIQ